VSETERSTDLSGLVGIRGEPFELVVERGKVREFALATKAAIPVYLDDSTPPIPPTFLASAAHWAPHEVELLERTGWDRRRMLHAAQEYVFPGPVPRAGARMRGESRIEAAYERQGRRGGTLRFVVLVTEFLGEDGTVKALARTTVVATSRAPGEA
jgi:hypothetical protein